MEEWYDRWDEEVQRLPPVLRQTVSRYLQRGRDTWQVRCECCNGHCVSLTYWWGTQEVIKRHTQSHLFPDQIVRWMRHIVEGSYNPAYALQFHTQETENKIQQACQELLTILEQEIEDVAKQRRETYEAK